MMPILSCSEGQCCRSATPHQFPQSKNCFNSWIIWSLRGEATLPWPRRCSHPPLTNVAFKYAGVVSALISTAVLCAGCVWLFFRYSAPGKGSQPAYQCYLWHTARMIQCSALSWFHHITGRQTRGTTGEILTHVAVHTTLLRMSFSQG